MTVETELISWRNEVNEALQSILRSEQKQNGGGASRQAVYLPNSKLTNLRIYNWKVWCKRYSISLEFLIQEILYHFRFARRHSGSYLRLGLPLGMITGVGARKILEERILKAFPNQENFKVSEQIQPSPLTGIFYRNTQEMVRNYSKIMEKRHKARRASHRRCFRKATQRILP